MLRPFIVHKMDHLLIYLDFFLREEHSTSKIRLNLNRESLTNPPEHFFNKQILSKSTFLDKPIDSYFIQKENIKPNNTLNFCSKMIRLWAAEKVVLPLMHEADLCQNEFSTLSNQFARTCCDTLQINSISKETLLSSYLRSLKTNFGFAREVMTAKSNLAARLSRVFGFTAAPAHKTALRHVYNDLKDFKHGDSGLNLITKNFVLNAFAEKISSNKKSPVLYGFLHFNINFLNV